MRKTVPGKKRFYQELALIRDDISYIFFIPTKYRVYYDFIEKEEKGQLPNAQWEYLSNVSEKLNLKCINLTQPLIEESKKIISKNKLTYWKDDTHWNKYGISVAARIVYDSVE